MTSDRAVSASGGIAAEKRCVVLCAHVADGVTPEQGYAMRDILNAAETIGWWFVNPGTFLVVFASAASGSQRASIAEAKLMHLSDEHPDWPRFAVGVAEGAIFGAFTSAGVLESMPAGGVVSVAMTRAIANAG